MRTRLLTLLTIFLSVLASGGCTLNRPPAIPPAPPSPNADIVFVANGSGDSRTTTHALTGAVAATGVPLRVETFPWSHGSGRLLVDHLDHCNQVDEGRRLAGLVWAARTSCPGRAVYLVGHSSGTAVVLAAAEALPPGSVERIVLLAPAVSADYDLRPALRTARQGIDVFYSRRDIGALGIGTSLVGTADNCWGAAAGRVGFRPIVETPCDAELYSKLRGHPWDPCLAWTGHHGGHFGSNREDYTRTFLLPLLVRPPCPPQPSAVAYPTWPAR
jgi:pimeloyl-ACP methyl ester carboxylesterase